jgi:hypothetical protein
VGVAESCACGVFAWGGVPGAGVPPLPDELDPITTPAQPLPIIEAASIVAIKHFDILLASDLFSAIVRQV